MAGGHCCCESLSTADCVEPEFDVIYVVEIEYDGLEGWITLGPELWMAMAIGQ